LYDLTFRVLFVFETQTFPHPNQGPKLAVVVLHLQPVWVELNLGMAPAHADVADSDVTFTAASNLDHVALFVEVDDVESACQVVLFVECLQHHLVLHLRFSLLQKIHYLMAVETVLIHE